MPNVTPGWKTTEFWMTSLSMIVGLLLASGIVPTEGVLMKAIAIVQMILASLGYSVARGVTKSGAARADAVVAAMRPPS